MVRVSREISSFLVEVEICWHVMMSVSMALGGELVPSRAVSKTKME
jgi:hypothetical protein